MRTGTLQSESFSTSHCVKLSIPASTWIRTTDITITIIFAYLLCFVLVSHKKQSEKDSTEYVLDELMSVRIHMRRFKGTLNKPSFYKTRCELINNSLIKTILQTL